MNNSWHMVSYGNKSPQVVQSIIEIPKGSKAKYELDFEGVRFIVDHGIVTLSGRCATQRSKDKVEFTVKNLYGVKRLISHIEILPVTIGTDHLLKQAVDSILQKYPLAEAITSDSLVTLLGRIEADKFSKLEDEISKLKPRKLQNSLERY